MSFIPTVVNLIAESGTVLAATGAEVVVTGAAAIAQSGSALGAASTGLGAAGAGTVVAGAGALATSYSAGATARYGTLRYQERNADLIGPDDRPLLVDETIMNSLQGQLYVFTHKAIWGCWLLLPAGGHAARDVVNTVVTLPPTEHWAFVARAECTAIDPPQVAYFIAQFGNGDFIPPREEAGENGDNAVPFSALLQETDKAHAALCIVQGPSNPDVWIHNPDLRPKRYVYKDNQLRSPGFRADEWVPMSTPMKLRQLNDRIYNTSCTGRSYDAINNNCQDFSMALFNDL